MNLRQLPFSPALLFAFAAPLLYAATNLIAFQIAAEPTGQNPWYEVPWNEVLLKELDKAVAQARKVALGSTLVLVLEAVLLAGLDRESRQPVSDNLPMCVLTSAMYSLTLAVAVGFNPTTSMWRLNDNHDLEAMSPAWYGPALMVISVVTPVSLAIWLALKVRGAPQYRTPD